MSDIEDVNEDDGLYLAEYIWPDGTEPTAQLRSKIKVVKIGEEPPEWDFDGSSTFQSPTKRSDLGLRPVCVKPHPLLRHSPRNRLVLCEVLDQDGLPHQTNTRAPFEEVVKRYAKHKSLAGVEQEYVMMGTNNLPLGWPDNGYPEPQGPYYCGVGFGNVAGIELMQRHLEACLAAKLLIYGINAEVMLGQGEYQIGTGDPLEVADHLLLARWLMDRLGEKAGVRISLHPKPVEGDWNGSGAHTNFSSAETRGENGEDGLEQIQLYIERLRGRHEEHIANYGHDIELRLSGRHETCHYGEFAFGDSDRGSSVRVSRRVTKARKGYFEDRRPCANMDPYVVLRLIMQTVFES